MRRPAADKVLANVFQNFNFSQPFCFYEPLQTAVSEKSIGAWIYSTDINTEKQISVEIIIYHRYILFISCAAFMVTSFTDYFIENVNIQTQ